MAFDLATHRGYDSDHPRVVGDVGKAGVAIDSVEDMKILFDGIPLEKVSVSMTMNGAVLPVLAGYIVAAEEQGVPQDKLSGTIQNDILKEFMVRNTYIYPPKPSMRVVGDIIGYTAAHMPKFNSISISGYHMQEAGANQTLELAFTLADGKDYVKTALSKGMDVDAFAGRLSFFFAIGMNFYLEVAKLRAARLLWWRIMKGFNPKNPEIHDAAYPLPDFGLVAGGTGSVQQCRAHDRRSDGGSIRRHPVPAHQFAGRGDCLADRILVAHRAQHAADHSGRDAHLQRHRSVCRFLFDGAADAGHGGQGVGDHRRSREDGRHDQGRRIGLGETQDRSSAADKQARIDSGKDVIVGVNKYKLKEEAPLETREIDNTAVRESQVARLGKIRASRDGAAVQQALAALTECASSGNGNLLDLTVKAMRLRATVGEVSDALEKVWGRFRATTQSVSGVYGAAFAEDAGWQQIKDGYRKLRQGRRAASAGDDRQARAGRS